MSVFSAQGTISSFGKEWIGLLGAFFWFFSLMLSYDERLMGGTAILAVFLLVLALSLFGFAILADRREAIFRHILFPAGFAGSALTASLGFLPDGLVQVAFCVIPVLMAPVLCRRLYGIFVTAKPGKVARGYISAVSATIVLHLVWVMLPTGDGVRFGISAAMAVLGLWRAGSAPVAAGVPTADKRVASFGSVTFLPPSGLPTRGGRTKAGLFRRIGATVLFLFLLSAFNLFCSYIHTAVVRGTYLEGDLFAVSAFVLMPFSFLFFAWMSDRGLSRRGFLIGLGLVFAGCCAAVLPVDSIGKAPLLLLGEFGGTITEFTFLTATLTIFPTARRKYLAASTGLILHTLLASLPSWLADLFMPASFLDPAMSRGFVVFGAASAFLLVLLFFWLSESARTYSPIEPTARIDEKAPFGEEPEAEEVRIVPAEDSLLLFTRQYGLTERQAEILKALLEGGTSKEIARRLFVTEATVKFHVHNILTKTGFRNRAELAASLTKSSQPED